MRHLLPHLPIPCALIAGLCLVASLCSASPPKLYFQKSLGEKKSERYAYQIEKGDHVYDILRRFKISSELRPRILKKTKELNPHIEDLDRVQPGQIVYFPSSVKKHSDFTVPEVPNFESPVPTTDYTVRPGEHLGEILRQKVDLSDRLIFDEYLELFRKLNPQIQDPDYLAAGQRITLPLPPEREREKSALFSRKDASESSTVEDKSEPRRKKVSRGTPPRKPQQFGIDPSSEIVSEPEPGRKRKKTDSGSVLDEITLLSQRNASAGSTVRGKSEPEGEKASRGNTSSAPADSRAGTVSEPESAPEPEPKPEPERKKNGMRLALKMLREMGFNSSAEEKILYPSREGGWVHIDLDRTPILDTPWGQSLLLVPDKYATSLLEKKVDKTDLRSCRVGDSWGLSELFRNLQKATDSRLIFWSPGESLIRNFQGMVLEIRGKYQFVIKAGGQSRYHLFFRAPLEKRRSARMLAGFLEQKGFSIHTMAGSDRNPKLTRIEPLPPGQIDQPLFSFANIWPRVEDKLASRGEEPDPPDNRNPGTLLNYLRERDMAGEENIRLKFLQKEDHATSISLSLRTTKLSLAPPAVLLQEMNDPHLCGLIGLEGYDCYTLGR